MWVYCTNVLYCGVGCGLLGWDRYDEVIDVNILVKCVMVFCGHCSMVCSLLGVVIVSLWLLCVVM